MHKQQGSRVDGHPDAHESESADSGEEGQGEEADTHVQRMLETWVKQTREGGQGGSQAGAGSRVSELLPVCGLCVRVVSRCPGGGRGRGAGLAGRARACARERDGSCEGASLLFRNSFTGTVALALMHSRPGDGM